MGIVRIYTDGAARGNPDGPGGYGVVTARESFMRRSCQAAM